MKTFAAVVLVSTVAASVHAEELTTTPAPRAPRLDHGQRRKVAGVVVSAIGIATLAAGTGLGIYSLAGHDTSGLLSIYTATGTITTLAGASMSAVGIPIWISGANEERAARTALSASAGGLTLQF